MRAANLSDEEEEDEWESDEELWDADASGVPVVVPGGVKRDKSGRVRGLKKGYIPLPTEEEEESSPVHGAVQRSAFFGSSPASEVGQLPTSKGESVTLGFGFRENSGPSPRQAEALWAAPIHLVSAMRPESLTLAVLVPSAQ